MAYKDGQSRGAMEIAEGAAHRKAAKCVRQKQTEIGCAL